MTTNLSVTSASHGTPKKNQNLVSRLMHLTATMFFAVMTLTAMSFNQDDTTKYSEAKGFGQNTSGDSSNTITLVNGVQRIVITNRSPFNAEVRINDMDLNTWVNSMMAYSYKRVNYGSIGTADYKMDAAFTNDEVENFNRSVSFGKNLANQLGEADQELHEQFVKEVETPLYQKSLNEELVEADARMDKILNDEAENKMKAAQFTKTMNGDPSDEYMDMKMNASLLSNISPVSATDADQKMDDVFLKNTFKNIDATSVFEADKKMDELMNKCN